MNAGASCATPRTQETLNYLEAILGKMIGGMRVHEPLNSQITRRQNIKSTVNEGKRLRFTIRDALMLLKGCGIRSDSFCWGTTMEYNRA